MPKHVLFGVLILSLATFLGACASLPAVNVHTWDTTAKAVYPERDDPRFRVPWLDQSRTVGVVFSGGGTRAAAATLGQLRALDCLGWLPKVSYISAVSGGSWAAVPYTYLPPEIGDQQFLGPYLPPQKLTDTNLGEEPDKQSLTWAINHAWPFWRAVSHMVRLRGDESYAAGLGDIFLRPFGLGDRGKLFSFHRKALQATLDENHGVLKESDFLLAREGRPYLVVGTTLMGKIWTSSRADYFPVELTPLYSGMVPRVEDPRNKERHFGGGFVESLAFDSRQPRRNEPRQGMTTIRIGLPRYRFTLSDMIAASGAAPQQWLTRHLIDNIGFPEFRQWPIDASNAERETHFGDGGHVDNVGIMPLLARQVPNILVFVNTATPFKPWPKVQLYGDVVRFFRKIEGEEPEESSVVIDSGEQKLRELVAAFTAAKDAGRPLVHCDRYKTVENPRFAVHPYEASICWVYLDATGDWFCQLDQKNNARLREIANAPRFPHYRTFFQRGAEVVRLSVPDVNALSNLTAWTVMTEQATIAEKLGITRQETRPCSPDGQ